MKCDCSYVWLIALRGDVISLIKERRNWLSNAENPLILKKEETGFQMLFFRTSTLFLDKLK